MKRKGAGRDDNGLTPEDRRIWGRVAGSVTPPRLRKAVRIATEGPALSLDSSAASLAAGAKPMARPASKRLTPALAAFWDFVLEFAPAYLDKLAHPAPLKTGGKGASKR